MQGDILTPSNVLAEFCNYTVRGIPSSCRQLFREQVIKNHVRDLHPIDDNSVANVRSDTLFK